MNEFSYTDESNLLGQNISDGVDPTISADTLAWPNYVLLWINVTTGALGCCANGFVLFLILAAKTLRVHPSYFLIKFQIHPRLHGLCFARCFVQFGVSSKRQCRGDAEMGERDLHLVR